MTDLIGRIALARMQMERQGLTPKWLILGNAEQHELDAALATFSHPLGHPFPPPKVEHLTTFFGMGVLRWATESALEVVA